MVRKRTLNPYVNKGQIMNALDNRIRASTVGLIYTFQLCSAHCTSPCWKKSFAILSQYFAESVKTRKKR